MSRKRSHGKRVTVVCHCVGARQVAVTRERLGLSKLSFHSFPKEGTAVAKEWIAKFRRDPGSSFVIHKHTKICSDHFTSSEFVATVLDYPLERRHLKPNAVPSIFPWTTEVQRSIRLQGTTSLLQQSEYSDDRAVSDINPNPNPNPNLCRRATTVQMITMNMKLIITQTLRKWMLHVA